jgi:hypothetical protein
MSKQKKRAAGTQQQRDNAALDKPPAAPPNESIASRHASLVKSYSNAAATYQRARDSVVWPGALSTQWAGYRGLMARRASLSALGDSNAGAEAGVAALEPGPTDVPQKPPKPLIYGHDTKKKLPCSKAQIKAEENRCAQKFARERHNFDDLENQETDIEKRADDHEKAVITWQTDLTQYNTDLTTYLSDLAGYKQALAAAKGRRSKGLQALEKQFLDEFTGLRLRYADLVRRAVNLNFDAKEIYFDADTWNDDLANLIARLEAFLKSLKCIKCRQARGLLNTIRSNEQPLNLALTLVSLSQVTPPPPVPQSSGSKPRPKDVPAVSSVRWTVEKVVLPCDFSPGGDPNEVVEGEQYARGGLSAVISAQLLGPSGQPVSGVPVFFNFEPASPGSQLTPPWIRMMTASDSAQADLLRFIQFTDSDGKATATMWVQMYPPDDYYTIDQGLFAGGKVESVLAESPVARMWNLELFVINGWASPADDTDPSSPLLDSYTSRPAIARKPAAAGAGGDLFVEPKKSLVQTPLGAQDSATSLDMALGAVGASSFVQNGVVHFQKTSATIPDLYGVLKWALDRYLDGLRDRLFPPKAYDALLAKLGVTDAEFRACLYGYLFGLPKGVWNSIDQNFIQPFDFFTDELPKMLFNFLKQEIEKHPLIFIKSIVDTITNPGQTLAKYIVQKGLEAYAFLDKNKDAIERLIATLKQAVGKSKLSVADALDRVSDWIYSTLETQLKPMFDFLGYKKGSPEYTEFMAAFVAGDIVGYVSFEAGLHVVVGLLTEGAGNAVMAMAEMGGALGTLGQGVLKVGGIVVKVSEAVGEIVEVITRFVKFVNAKVLEILVKGGEVVAKVFSAAMKFLIEASEAALTGFFRLLQQAAKYTEKVLNDLTNSLFRFMASFFEGARNRIVMCWESLYAVISDKLTDVVAASQEMLDIVIQTAIRTFEFLANIAEMSQGVIAKAEAFAGDSLPNAVGAISWAARAAVDDLMIELISDHKTLDDPQEVEQFLLKVGDQVTANDLMKTAVSEAQDTDGPDVDRTKFVQQLVEGMHQSAQDFEYA